MVFLKLKPLCTSLLRTPKNPSVDTLKAIAQIVRDAPPGAFTPALVEYTFFPLSHILRLTPIPDQPNHVLEQILLVLAALAQHWDPEQRVWDQLVVLATSVVQSKRDEETTLAAVLVLSALLRPATDPRFHAATVPVVGKALDVLLEHTTSPNHTLQSTTLSTLLVLVRDYIPDEITPLILPGIVSNTTRTALSRTPAESIHLALDLLRTITTRAISDEVCTRDGALHDIRSLDDLLVPEGGGSKERSLAWLKATSAQLHIALNTLSLLVEHPNPVARQGLVALCTFLIQTCARTLEASQPLLLSHLLVLAYPALSTSTTAPPDATQALTALRSTPALPIATQTSRALSLLPHRLTPTHQPTASLLARQLVSACSVLPQTALLATGIQKWGRTLTSALRFQSPSIVLLGDVRGLIEPTHTSDKLVEAQPYPTLTLVGLDPQVHAEVQQVFIALGKASADQGLFAIEWFVGVGTAGRDEAHVAALWCALHLFRGVLASKAGRIAKAARWIGRTVAEMWDDRFEERVEEGEGETLQVAEYVKGLNPLTTLLDRGGQSRPGVNWVRKREVQLQHASLSLQLLATSHLALATWTTSVPTTSIYASTLSTNPSVTLLQYTLYPLLLSLLSPAGVLASTAHTALVEVSDGLGYASVSNLLLANFDYALEAVARRISAFSTYAALGVPTSTNTNNSNAPDTTTNTSISVSIQALQVLRTLINLIGRAIIDRATDVLDECFDRLDDFHGYSAVVHALVGVLTEVVAVVGREDEGKAREGEREDVYVDEGDEGRWERFVEWFQNRGKEEADVDFKGKGKAIEEDEEPKPLEAEEPQPEADDPPPLPASQTLTRQIIARGTYFLTHPSPYIRAQILHLLATAAPTLRASALLPTIHASWPFILNRLGDKEPFVVLAAARLVESLVLSVGDFMARRVWEDVWPKFEKMLKTHAETSLIRPTRPGPVQSGYESYGPRALSDLHLSILHTLAGAATHVEPNDDAVWNLLLLCRRFLIGSSKPGSTRIQRNEWGERQDVQQAAREVYIAVGKRNPDVVWLVLAGTCGGDPRVGEQEGLPAFLREEWDVKENVALVLNEID